MIPIPIPVPTFLIDQLISHLADLGINYTWDQARLLYSKFSNGDQLDCILRENISLWSHDIKKIGESHNKTHFSSSPETVSRHTAISSQYTSLRTRIQEFIIACGNHKYLLAAARVEAGEISIAISQLQNTVSNLPQDEISPADAVRDQKLRNINAGHKKKIQNLSTQYSINVLKLKKTKKTYYSFSFTKHITPTPPLPKRKCILRIPEKFQNNNNLFFNRFSFSHNNLLAKVMNSDAVPQCCGLIFDLQKFKNRPIDLKDTRHYHYLISRFISIYQEQPLLALLFYNSQTDPVIFIEKDNKSSDPDTCFLCPNLTDSNTKLSLSSLQSHAKIKEQLPSLYDFIVKVYLWFFPCCRNVFFFDFFISICYMSDKLDLHSSDSNDDILKRWKDTPIHMSSYLPDVINLCFKAIHKRNYHGAKITIMEKTQTTLTSYGNIFESSEEISIFDLYIILTEISKNLLPEFESGGPSPYNHTSKEHLDFELLRKIWKTFDKFINGKL